MLRCRIWSHNGIGVGGHGCAAALPSIVHEVFCLKRVERLRFQVLGASAPVPPSMSNMDQPGFEPGIFGYTDVRCPNH